MLRVFKVKGNSMLPALAAGDFVIASSWFFRLKTKDYIVAKHPNYQDIIKRIDKVCTKRGFLLASEHRDGLSSAQIGWLKREQIIAKVIFKISA